MYLEVGFFLLDLLGNVPVEVNLLDGLNEEDGLLGDGVLAKVLL